jgi:hypothetical protein
MSVVIEQLKRAQNIDLDSLGIKATIEHQNAIVNLNRDQLRKGQRGEGDMPGYFSAAYLNYKRSLDSYFAGGKTDLFLTGDFQKSMYLAVNGKSAEISATDWKTEQLLEKYGEGIFNLNGDFMPQAHELTTPTFFKLAHDFLQGK